jgi:uncharacterized protein
MANDFMVVRGLIGGALIGLASAILFHFHGRIAGISGIFSGLLPPRGDGRWRLIFVSGLIAGGFLVAMVAPSAIGAPVQPSIGLVLLAGFLVGFGTRLGGGCTSGHGVCGLSRLSKRSMAATVTFIAFGAVTVLVLRALSSGAS